MYFFALFLCTCTIQLCLGGLEMGKISNVDVTDVEGCENDVGTTYFVELVKEGDVKWFRGNITADYDLTADLTFKVNVDRWSGSEWKAGFIKQGGNLCEAIAKAEKTWRSLVDALIPKPASYECNTPKGTYVVEKFEPNLEEILSLAPKGALGKYRGKGQVFKGKDIIACGMGVVEVKN